MAEVKDKLSSHLWWFDSNKNNKPNRSTWLQSTLAEVDEKTKAMLRIIEEDADSFAQRAEMYYKKRPQLINMVQDFYRAHRLLAEKYDQIKCENGTRLLTTPWGSPLSCTKYPQEKLMSSSEKAYDSYSEEAFDPETDSSCTSEVEDPDIEEDIQAQPEESGTVEVSSSVVVKLDEVQKLREEIERLKEKNRAQQELLMQKDEEKREVIRQLSLAVDVTREENIMLRKNIAKASPKKEQFIELKSISKASPKKEQFIELKSIAKASPKKEQFIELKTTSNNGFWKKLFSRSP